MLPGQPLHPLKHALQIFTDASKGWGAHLNEHTCKGNLVPSKKQVAYKPLGTEGGLSGPKRVPRPLFKQHSSGGHRQHNGGCLYQQGRGLKSRSLCSLLWRILSWCTRKQVTLKAHHIPGWLNVIADKLSRLGHTIQGDGPFTQRYSKLYAPGGTTRRWTCLQPGSTRNCHSFRHPSMGSGCTRSVLEKSGPLCLPTSSHFGQSGGEVAGLPMQQNHINCTGVAQHALVLGSSGNVQSIPLCLPNLPNLVSQPFNQTLHRHLSNLNLHAWLLEPQQSRSRAPLRQWQHELRLLKEDQLCPSMRQSGPFLQSGASVIRWTSGHHL